LGHFLTDLVEGGVGTKTIGIKVTEDGGPDRELFIVGESIVFVFNGAHDNIHRDKIITPQIIAGKAIGNRVPRIDASDPLTGDIHKDGREDFGDTLTGDDDIPALGVGATEGIGNGSGEFVEVFVGKQEFDTGGVGVGVIVAYDTVGDEVLGVAWTFGGGGVLIGAVAVLDGGVGLLRALPGVGFGNVRVLVRTTGIWVASFFGHFYDNSLFFNFLFLILLKKNK